MTSDEKEFREDHLDELELDAQRGGEGSAAGRRHLEACSRCQAALEALERDAAALRGAHLQPSPPPPEVEGRILASLKKEAPAPQGAKKPPMTPALSVVGALAALVLIVILSRVGGRREAAPPSGEETALPASPVAADGLRGDLNGDGILDDGDLGQMHRTLAQGVTPPESWDLSGDGRVDEEDLRVLDRLVAAAGAEAEAEEEDTVGC